MNQTFINRSVLRVLKIKSGQHLMAISSHNNRDSKPDNVDMSKKDIQFRGSRCCYADTMAFLKKHNVTKHRKNGVLAIEIVLSASRQYFYPSNNNSRGKVLDKEATKKWMQQTVKWLDSEFGYRVINIVFHTGESNFHAHATLIPHVKTFYKNGDVNSKLAANRFIGSKKLLSDLQSSYAYRLEDLGIYRGIKASDSKIKHQTLSHFYDAVEHAQNIVKIKVPTVKLEDNNYSNKLSESIDALSDHIQKTEHEVSQLKLINTDLTEENNFLKSVITEYLKKSYDWTLDRVSQVLDITRRVNPFKQARAP